MRKFARALFSRYKLKRLVGVTEKINQLKGVEFGVAVKLVRSSRPVTQIMIEALLEKNPPKAIYDGYLRWQRLPRDMELSYALKRQAMLIYVLEGKAADGSQV